MPWITIQYSPGFQEDLTSWVLSVHSDGRIEQEVDVRRFSPSEQRKEAFRSVITQNEVASLRQLITTLDFAEVEKAARENVVDDVEQIRVVAENGGKSFTFTAPLEYWSWQQEKGLAVSQLKRDAINLWRVLHPLSKYEVRHVAGA